MIFMLGAIGEDVIVFLLPDPFVADHEMRALGHGDDEVFVSPSFGAFLEVLPEFPDLQIGVVFLQDLISVIIENDPI